MTLVSGPLTVLTMFNMTAIYYKLRAERAAYHLMRERAQREPDLYTVMIVDGMDQSKTNVPQMTKDKDTASLAKLHVHLTG